MTHPTGSFLDGALNGFERGHAFRVSRADRRREQEERERRRRIEDEELAYRRRQREREEAEAIGRTGIGVAPPSAPRVEFNAPRFGQSFGDRSHAAFGVQAPPSGFLGDTRVGSLRQEVGRMLQQPHGQQPMPGVGVQSRAVVQAPAAQPQVDFGGFRRVGPSAEDRESMESARVASQVGAQLAGMLPGGEQLSPEAQTMLGMGRIPVTAVTGMYDRAQVAREAAAYRERYRGRIPARLTDEETVRLGRYLFQQQNDLRPVGSGTGGGTTTAREHLRTVEGQVDDTRTNLARAERQMPTRPEFFATPEGERRFVQDSTRIGTRVNQLQQRADSLDGVRDSLAGVVQGRRPAPAARPQLSVTRAEYDAIVREHGAAYASRHFRVQ